MLLIINLATNINCNIIKNTNEINSDKPIIVAPIIAPLSENLIEDKLEIDNNEIEFIESEVIEYIDRYTIISLEYSFEVEEVEEQYFALPNCELAIFTTYVYHGTRKPLPASENLQKIVHKYAEKYGLPYKIILALLGVETTWNENPNHTELHNDVKYIGIGCINENYHAVSLSNKGIDIYTLEGCVEGVCWLLKAQYDRFGTIELALMAYNGGGGYAQWALERDVTENGYSRDVMAYAESFQ